MEYKKNQELTVTITDCGNDGEGIGKVDGYTLFVKDAIIGDEVLVGITKAKKNYAYARLIQIIKSSPDRVEPKCAYHKQCGGCQIQAMSYERQLSFKENKVRNNLIRIGGFLEEQINAIMDPIIGMEEPFRYRNKAQYPVGTNKEGNLITGFYAGRTHNIIANTDCLLGQANNQYILKEILSFMEDEGITAYDEKTQKGVVRHILIREGFISKEIMVCLVINKNKLPSANLLVDRLKNLADLGDRIASICVNVNKENTNVILGREVQVLFGKGYITDSIGGIKFQISPLSFYQVNPVQTEKLYSKALEYAQLTGEETVWDLYCGIGTISLFLAQKAKQVYGVEIVEQAIEDAKHNAEINGIENAQFYVGKAEEVLPEKYEKERIYADVIVVDPPRKGCDEACLETMIKMQPKRIVYVSCDSATLARDLKYLCENGYELNRVQAVDQFCHTGHVETVALLSLKTNQPKLEVTMEVDSDSNYTPEERTTYQKIKAYVKDKYGVNVHTSYIAQVKRMCGLEMGENHNKSKKENPEVKQCPQEKVEYIKDALKHFGLI